MSKKILGACLFLFLLLWRVSCQAGDCSVDNWCKMESGTTNSLYAVWGSSANDIFTVGGNGTIRHYDGINWSAMDSGTTTRLRDVWGNNDEDVFVVGDLGTILHYDGVDWTKMNTGILNDLKGVWGTSGKDVFAVGNSGTILHFDGSTWSEMNHHLVSKSDLYDVWGNNGKDVFVVGTVDRGVYSPDENGLILHYDGITWSEMYLLIQGWDTSLTGVWGSSGYNVFVVGTDYTSGLESSFAIILSYNGKEWSYTEFEYTFGSTAVWGSGDNDVFVIIFNPDYNGYIKHYSGTSWDDMRTDANDYLTAVWGSSPNNVFVTGHGGIILRRHLPGPFQLSVSVSGKGTVTSVPAGINCPPDCKKFYTENTPVKLRALPAKGAIFGSWSGSGCRGTDTCTVIMDRDRHVSANFGKKGAVPWSILLLKNQQ